MQRVLITGINGFVGPYLARELRGRGVEVRGTAFGRTPPHPLELGLEPTELDVRDPAAVRDLVRTERPDAIIHLAAFSSPAESRAAPLLTMDVNLVGTTHLLEALRLDAPGTRCLVVGSSDVYGQVPETALPVTEDAPLAPESPYAVTKMAVDFLAERYVQAFGLDVVRVRPFNHTGPGQTERFVCSDFAAQVARAERTPGAEVHVRDPSVCRDFTDVRDMCRAYALTLEHGARGAVYNLCSGRSVSMGEVLATLASLARVPLTVTEGPTRAAGALGRSLYGSAARFEAVSGWRPEIPFERTLADLLDEWRARIASESA